MASSACPITPTEPNPPTIEPRDALGQPDARNSRQQTLAALRGELAFLLRGGYTSPAETPWRTPWVLLDSPICRRGSGEGKPSCRGCTLLAWAPAAVSAAAASDYRCYDIVMGPNGETLGAIVRLGNLRQTEARLEAWLRARIQELERVQEMPTPRRGPTAVMATTRGARVQR